MPLTVIPLKAKRQNGNFVLFDELTKILSENAKNLSKKYKMKPEFVEIVLRESDKIFGCVSGVVITSSDNILAPNSGIDK